MMNVTGYLFDWCSYYKSINLLPLQVIWTANLQFFFAAAGQGVDHKENAVNLQQNLGVCK
jgi:hypothetical protein